MRIDGFNTKRNKELGYRYSNPEQDVDLDGNSVESTYVSFVRINDCCLYEKDGISYYDPKNAPSIPIGHGGTYYGYGHWKRRKSEFGVWVGEELLHEYMQCTVYFVRKGCVYTSSIQRKVDENVLERDKIKYENWKKKMKKKNNNKTVIK